MSNENIAMENEALEAAEAAEAAEAVEVTAEAEKAEVTEASEPETEAAEEEIEEPKIMLFLDEEEEQTEEAEEYTPKAVAYQETVKEEESKKTPEQLNLEEEIENEKFIRDETAWMFERKLFNIPAWFSLSFVFGSIPVIYTGAYLSRLIGGVNASIVDPEMTGLGVLAAAYLQIVFAILCFIKSDRSHVVL